MQKTKRTEYRRFARDGVSLAAFLLFSFAYSGCGNAQFNWAQLVANAPFSSQGPSSNQTKAPLPKLTENRVQVGGGQAVVSGSGVNGLVWLKNGVQSSTGPGVTLKNVVIK
ncbi:MAG: hypothetical protein HYX41_03840 [Bdellovibrio sp.]|nr:hypothetical protein [Bdellovibrio sp.]